MPKKRTGTVFRCKNGTYQIRVLINGKRVSKYAKTLEQAEQIRQELLEQFEIPLPKVKQPKPEPPKPEPDTFAAFAEQWLATESLKPVTAESYKDILRKYIVPIIGDKLLSEVTTLDVAKVISETRKAGVSDRTVQYVFGITRRVLEVAYEWDLISRNPAARLKKPKAEPGEKTIWTVEQTQRFIVRQGSGPWDSLFMVTLFTGLRIGELLGLKWTDIDFQVRTLRVQRSLMELTGLRYHLQTPKSKTSVRTISLSEQVITALEQWEPDTDKRNSFIFRRKDNSEPPSRSTLRSAFVAACKHAEVPYISIHGLRHLHVSLLAHAGVSVKAAQQRVGHSTPQITLQVYTHVMPEVDRQSAAAIDSLLRGKPDRV